MLKPGTVSLKCASWNIAGKFNYFRSSIMQNLVERFDIICLTETHTIKAGSINFKNFKRYEFPDTNCNCEHPRGGICLLVKIEKLKVIKSVQLLMTDFIRITFTNGLTLNFLYVPPVDSVYYNENYIQLLCSLFWEADDSKFPMIAMGDTNTRLGDLTKICEGYHYTMNPDDTVNENGKYLSEILFNSTSATPINHMKTDLCQYDGDYTFNRNGKKSQIDWCFGNKFSLSSIYSFKIVRDAPAISDHKPILIEINVSGEKSIDTILSAARELNVTQANHSRIPVISNKNTNLQALKNLIQLEVSKCDSSNMNSNEISEFLTSNIQKYGKITHTAASKNTSFNERVNTDNESVCNVIDNNEISKWNFVNECNDSKQLWQSINMKGEIKPEVNDCVAVDELADCFSKKSRIDVTQTLFKDINTDVKNDELDRDIDKKEVEEALESLNVNSKTGDGITPNCVKAIFPVIINMLLLMLNLVFKGGADAYPKNWLNFVNGIPKKGRLEPPKFVRFINIMGLFEKLYQTILNSRLYAFLTIPSPQTAYQKKKGCNLHVMSIRLLKILTTKTKQKLFIIFTDFEAAFDLVSRKLLFEKLVKIGISSVMLTALISIYVSSKSVMEHNGQFSDIMLLLAGIKQGAPPSGILYIVYTLGIIDLFNMKFNPEPLLSIFHLLMHADDILLLATTRILAVMKLKELMIYCKENFIKLQLVKCAMMCVNSNDVRDMEPITVDSITMRCETSEIYLGSVITNSTKLKTDVEADIKHRQLNVIKFYAFLRINKNAPVAIKLKVLDSCIISSILHNAETWADVNIERLEVMHRRMLKSILGVRTTTCSEFMYIELGVTPIKAQVLMKQWKFWNKVKELNSTDPLGYVINLCKRYKVKEVRHYERLIEKYAGVEEIRSQFVDKIKSSINQKSEQGRSKYSTYININPNLETPRVYASTEGYQNTSIVAKLRTSSHNLQIEMGRRLSPKPPKEERKCHCGLMEDETHFLSQCEAYEHIRRKYGVHGCRAQCLLEDGKHADYIKELYQERDKHLNNI